MSVLPMLEKPSKRLWSLMRSRLTALFTLLSVFVTFTVTLLDPTKSMPERGKFIKICIKLSLSLIYLEIILSLFFSLIFFFFSQCSYCEEWRYNQDGGG